MPRPPRSATRVRAPRTETRLFGLRKRTRRDRGQGTIEYVGITFVVTAIVAGLLLTGVGAPMAEKFANTVCRVIGMDGCGGGDAPTAAAPENAGDGTGGPAGTGDPDTQPDPAPATDPERVAYEAAQRELAAAQAAYASDNEKAREAALALAKLLADELGITDAVACITEGDSSACTETLINVLSSLIGGAIGKLAAKYGAPWKWKQAAALVAKLKKHGGDLYDGLTGLVKNRKRVADAQKTLDKAADRYDPNTPVKPRRPDVTCPAPMTAGRVPLGGGTSPPTTAAFTTTPAARRAAPPPPPAAAAPPGPATEQAAQPARRGGTPWSSGAESLGEFEAAGPQAVHRGAAATPHGRRAAQPHAANPHDRRAAQPHAAARAGYPERPATCTAFPAAPNVTGPAAGKTLKTPHPRHTVAGAKHGMVKAKNSVILKGNEAAIDADVKAIAEGRATFDKTTSRYRINGRTYGVEDNGRVYPDSGPGIVNLDRNEYAALTEIAKANGDTSVPAIRKNPRFSDPKVVEKAKQVYDGTYR